MSDSTDSTSSQRMQGIDLFRVIAILAVIVIHTSPFRGGVGRSGCAQFFINQAVRFAVPFFFIVSGYFWAVKSRMHSLTPVTMKQMKRLLSLFIFWSVFYVVFAFAVSGLLPGWFGMFGRQFVSHVKEFLTYPTGLLFEGVSVHLWFLVALMHAVVIGWAVIRYGAQKWFLPAGIALYVAGVLGGSYAGTHAGLNLHFDTRNGPFFSTLFFAAGWWLAVRKGKPASLRFAIYLTLTGMVLHFAERYYLLHACGTPAPGDYVFSTALYGLGVALIAFAIPSGGLAAAISKWGPYTLGIYVVHFVFVVLLEPLSRYVAYAPWQLVYPLAVFAVSLGTVYAFSRNSITRRLVM